MQRTAIIVISLPKALSAVKEVGCNTLVLAGGVAANSSLESRLRAATEKAGIRFCYPDKILCTDNAAMIGCRGYYQSLASNFADLYLNAVPGLELQDL